MADLKKTVAIELSAKTEQAVAAFKKLSKEEKKAAEGADKLKAAEKALSDEGKKLAQSTRVLNLQLKNSKARLLEMEAASARGAARLAKLRHGFGVAGRAAGIMAAATVAAGVGMFKLIESSAKTGDDNAKTAQALGGTTTVLQRLRFSAERSGGSAATMNRGLRIMTVGLQDAVTKGTGPAFEGLKAIGLEASNLQKLGMEDQFSTISDAMQKVGNQATKSAIAMKIFGTRGGAELKPLMDEGSDGIRALGDEAERLGLVMSEGATTGSERFIDSMLDARGAVTALGRDIGSDLLPVANETVDVFKEWVVENGDLIKQDIGDLGRSMADGFQAALPALMSTISALSTMAQTTEGLFLLFDDITGKSRQNAADSRFELQVAENELAIEIAGESFDRLRLRQDIGFDTDRLESLVGAEVDRRIAPAIAQAEAQAKSDQRLLVGGTIRDPKSRVGRVGRGGLGGGSQTDARTRSELSELSGQGGSFGTSREDTSFSFAGAGARDPFQTDEQRDAQQEQIDQRRLLDLEEQTIHDLAQARKDEEIARREKLDGIIRKNHDANMKRLQDSEKKEKAATANRIAGVNAFAGVSKAGADIVGLAAQAGAISAEKAARIQNRFLGMQAIGIGALEVVKAAAAAASFNVPQAVLHGAAAAVAFLKGGLLLSGTMDPSGGGASTAGSATQFGGGAGGGGAGSSPSPVGGGGDGGGSDLPPGPISRPDTSGGRATTPPQPGAPAGRTGANVTNNNVNITTLGTSSDEVWTTVQQHLDDNNRRVGNV